MEGRRGAGEWPGLVRQCQCFPSFKMRVCLKLAVQYMLMLYTVYERHPRDMLEWSSLNTSRWNAYKMRMVDHIQYPLWVETTCPTGTTEICPVS